MDIDKRVLVLDDDQEFLLKLQDGLSGAKYEVLTVSDVFELEKILSEDLRYLVLILSIDKTTKENIDLLKKIKKDYSFIEVIIIAKRGDVRSAFNSLMCGACNYLTKSESISDLVSVIDTAFKKALKKLGNSCMSVSLTTKKSVVKPFTTITPPEIIGDYFKRKRIDELIKKIAPSHLFVLITGETGVGKELIAQAIHYYSKCADKSFISFNCTAIPDTLLESELFGHEKGAFTDAISQKQGLFEEADRGTIFIDEIGEASPVFQVKLLRTIETGRFRRLGGRKEIEVDVRVISATNKDIYSKVKSKEFRADLFFRLAGVNIHIAPLRERRYDISLLANHFLNAINHSNGTKNKFSETALRILAEYDWPGNVRQLKNCVDKLAILSEEEIIKPKDIDLADCFPDMLISSSEMEKFMQKDKVNETVKNIKE